MCRMAVSYVTVAVAFFKKGRYRKSENLQQEIEADERAAAYGGETRTELTASA